MLLIASKLNYLLKIPFSKYTVGVRATTCEFEGVHNSAHSCLESVSAAFIHLLLARKNHMAPPTYKKGWKVLSSWACAQEAKSQI